MLYSVFLPEHKLYQKNRGVNLTPPPGKPCIGQHPGKGGVKVEHASWMLLMYIGNPSKNYGNLFCWTF